MQNISFGSFEFFILDFGSLGFGYVAVLCYVFVVVMCNGCWVL